MSEDNPRSSSQHDDTTQPSPEQELNSEQLDVISGGVALQTGRIAKTALAGTTSLTDIKDDLKDLRE